MWYFIFKSFHLIPLLWKCPLIFFKNRQTFSNRNILHHGFLCRMKTIISACLFWTFHVSVSFYIHHFFHLGRQFTDLLSTWLAVTQISHRWRIECTNTYQFNAPLCSLQCTAKPQHLHCILLSIPTFNFRCLLITCLSEL